VTGSRSLSGLTGLGVDRFADAGESWKSEFRGVVEPATAGSRINALAISLARQCRLSPTISRRPAVAPDPPPQVKLAIKQTRKAAA